MILLSELEKNAKLFNEIQKYINNNEEEFWNAVMDEFTKDFCSIKDLEGIGDRI